MNQAVLAAENQTRNVTLLERVRRADSFLTRLRGLTFRRHLAEGEGLLLVGHRESRADAAIHMFFVSAWCGSTEPIRSWTRSWRALFDPSMRRFPPPRAYWSAVPTSWNGSASGTSSVLLY
jgi:hypothetical protein